MTYRKKLIEVALPLDVVNQESAREKSIRHGHPSTLHLWWARRPLAACRAVLFASLVDDPSARSDEFPTLAAQEEERKRLLGIIERLVKWENLQDTALIEEAQAEILKSTDGNPPPVLDPFCGGGSIPLEVQRLGLEAHGSDLNPVAVLITKALIELPPKFANQRPVNPDIGQKKLKTAQWFGAQGLAEDVKYYGQWMRDQAEKKIGHLYPTVELADGDEAKVIAWLWARTVKCPNPGCGCEMPLVKSFTLSSKKEKEAWVEPIIDRTQSPPVISFEVKLGKGEVLDGTVGRSGGKCIACESPVPLDHIRSEGKAKRMGTQLMAIVAEGERGRHYLSASNSHSSIAEKVEPYWEPELDLPHNARNFNTLNYGLTTFGDLFTDRQLVALTTFSDLVGDARKQIKKNAVKAGMADDGVPLNEGGKGAAAYADAIATYLAFAIDRLADYGSSICTWNSPGEKMRNTFARQAIPMTWDFAEVNPFSNSSGNFLGAVAWVQKNVAFLPNISVKQGAVEQKDATTPIAENRKPLVFTTDPPYYDNISYAELSDFFYVWLRRSLEDIYPQLFSTLATPKTQELVAAPYRFNGNKKKAKAFFEEGLQKAFTQTYNASHPDYPFTVFYAFKQTETDKKGEGGARLAASSGWETMLESLIRSGFSVTGTWPMRTERKNRFLGIGANALASSIALVCRPLKSDAKSITRRQFLSELKRELPAALKTMLQGNIAPVDLAQASIGPGMAVYSRYKAVLEADGSTMRVRTALQLINQILDEYLSEQEGEFDADTRWALTWFEQHQFESGAYGDAETLSKAKVTSVQGLVDAGILSAQAGKVRLLKRDELIEVWNPDVDSRLPDWEAMQYLIRALQEQGESGAAKLLHKLGDRADATRDLAYRLYNICDRNGWTQEAIAYNSLVTSWNEIARLAADSQYSQGQLVGV